MFTAAEQRAEFLDILQHLLDHSRAFSQRTQEVYRQDFDRRLRKVCEWIRNDHYVFIDVSDGVTKASKLGDAVE